jgi:major membrane immunogen (membrane-anchored lipoprotein)
MKKTLILGIIITSTLLFSCGTSSERLEDSTYMTEQTDITTDNPFKLTIEDLREEQLEIEKKLTLLKNSDVERQSHDYKAFEPEIRIIELRIDSLKTQLPNFENASEEEKEVIYNRYKIKKEKITEDIEAITDRFNDLKVLDN